jgi:hypothetical protein
VGHRGAVRTRGGERVVDVDDAYDLRGEGDLVAAQAIRVSRPVVLLVVPADDRLDVPGELDALEQVDPPHRVHLHDLELVAREGAGLVEDLMGDLHLAEVVEVGAEPDGRDLQLVEAHLERDGDRVLGDARAMAMRVAVGRLDRAAPLADDGEVGALEVPDLAADVDQVAARVEALEEAVRAVQELERFLVAPHRLVHDREVARGFRLVQHGA